MVDDTTLSRRFRSRAWVVLASLENMDLDIITSKGRMTADQVKMWVDRYNEGGVEALFHNQFSKKPEELKRAKIIHYTLHAKPPNGKQWTGPALAELVGVTPQYVYYVWRQEGINPKEKK